MTRAKRSALPSAGAVLAIAVQPAGRVWLATPAGLFVGDGDGWEPAPYDFPHLNTVGVAGDYLFVAGPGGLACSADAGRSWQMGWHDPLDTAVTCLAASPNFTQDGTLLAGTGGDGILRSTDAGRHWELSNFGLRAFSVLALAVAPDWEWRETIYAATDDGVFVSPNAGRAWKRSGRSLEDQVQCVAVSPAFARDKTVLAGTEQRGLYRSTNAGQTWRHVKGIAGAVNSLVYCGGLVLAGTDGAILQSTDGGRRWTLFVETGSPVLCLALTGQKWLAGLGDGSVLSMPVPSSRSAKRAPSR